MLFIPSGDTPNKDMHHIDKHLKYNMVQKAIEGNEHFDISPIEREREGPSYTVDTIRLLRTSLSHDCQIFFICGTDAIVDLPIGNIIRNSLIHVTLSLRAGRGARYS